MRNRPVRLNLRFAMEPCRRLRAFITSGVLGAFLLALGLAAAPQWHEHFHPDAGLPSHQCAVTLVANGKCELGSTPTAGIAPQPALLFEKAPTLHAVEIAALFHGAAVFEHAPPLFA